MGINLDFSLIGPPSQKLRELLDEFQEQRHNVKINLISMSWENAWPKLLEHEDYFTRFIDWTLLRRQPYLV